MRVRGVCTQGSSASFTVLAKEKKTDKKGYLALDIVGKGWKLWLVAPAQPGFGL